MAELLPQVMPLEEKRVLKCAFAVVGIMSTLLVYGVLQEKIMRVPYGEKKEYFRYSLFLVFCNRITTSAVSACALLASKKVLDPVAPVYKYCSVSVSNILTTTCQYEALKYVSFPVQTLAKCAKMMPVMIWGTLIMQKKYIGKDYLFAFLVTLGCSIFILYPVSTDISPYSSGRESTVWGVSLMIGYLGYGVARDCFLLDLMGSQVHSKTSFSEDTIWKYTIRYSIRHFALVFLVCVGLYYRGIFFQQWNLFFAIMTAFSTCFCCLQYVTVFGFIFEVATISQFFISYTIRTFGALTFATIMTTRQLVSIFLSCVWFGHYISMIQWFGAAIVFGALYTRNFLKSQQPKSAASLEGQGDGNSANNNS